MSTWSVQVVTTLILLKASVINEADKHTQGTSSCTEGHVENSLWCLDTIVGCTGYMVGGGYLRTEFNICIT